MYENFISDCCFFMWIISETILFFPDVSTFKNVYFFSIKIRLFMFVNKRFFMQLLIDLLITE